MQGCDECILTAEKELTYSIDLNLNVVQGTPELECSKDGLPPSHDVGGIPQQCVLHNMSAL